MEAMLRRWDLLRSQCDWYQSLLKLIVEPDLSETTKPGKKTGFKDALKSDFEVADHGLQLAAQAREFDAGSGGLFAG